MVGHHSLDGLMTADDKIKLDGMAVPSIANTLDGNEVDKVPSVAAVKAALAANSGLSTSSLWPWVARWFP